MLNELSYTKNVRPRPPEKPTSAAIFGLEGHALTAEERAFFKEANPLGFILFARNIESPDQVRRLTDALKHCVQREDAWILIDQEGGRVARLKPPYFRACPPAGVFAKLAGHDLECAKKAAYLNARLMAHELFALGINVDCAPVADLRIPGAHDIIGDRAYGECPAQVALLAGQVAEGLLDGGVLPVIKHIPGHGRAHADSHLELPVVSEALELLNATDFTPFMALRHLPLAMTAHILYRAIDPNEVLTLSPRGIDFVRRQIGFSGLLMSDDLSMKALKGSLGDLARRALAAGCDVALHCNGNLEEMKAVMQAIGALSKEGAYRAQAANALLEARRLHSMRLEFEVAAAEAQLAGWLKEAAYA